MVSSKLSLTVAASLLVSNAAAALDPIVMKGTKFFFQNGTQFFMKGVAYQQDSAAAGASTGSSTFVDPLADATKCQRDVPILAGINTNVIRTYAIDPTKDHSACMTLLQNAGIYVIADLGEPNLSINRDSPQWNTALFARYTAVIDELAKYPNVIGFFAGNEVTNNATNTPASAFVKAAVRDTKAYIKATKSRWLGVGYAANDDPDIRADIAHYFNCGPEDDAIDFWGYNIYEWCGQNTFEGSGYSKQVDFFSTYSVPVFFAEYGCNTQGGAEGRIWQETTALYSNQMTGVISGGIVYMYFQEANDYGLVSIVGTQASTMKNYNALKTVIASVKPSSTAMSAYTPTNTPAACPSLASTWRVAENLPPTPDENLCQCMFKSLSCVPKSGLDPKKYGDIFNYICSQSSSNCAGIEANATSGSYGAYSMCSDTEKLGNVLDAYYKGQKSASSACDFGGQAQLQRAETADAACSSALSSATSSTGNPNETGKNAAGRLAPPVQATVTLGLGSIAVGAYMLVAAGVGASMLLL